MQYKYRNFKEMLEAVADKRASATAIFDGGSKLRYGELLARSRKFSAYLRSAGVKAGDRVAMIATNCSEFVVSYFGITSIGAVAVPLNTFLKFDEFSYILNDCGAKILVASSELSRELIGLNEGANLQNFIWIGGVPSALKSLNEKMPSEYEDMGESAYLDAAREQELPQEPKFNAPKKHVSFEEALEIGKDSQDRAKFTAQSDQGAPSIDDLAHVIYTSGTTGRPKGAMISYKNVFSNLQGAHERFKVRPTDRFIVFLPMFHSFTLTAMMLLPIYGEGSAVLVRSVFPFSNVLKQALLKRVTIFLGIPAIYAAIGKAKIPWYFRWFNAIRLFICGAAPLAKQTIEDFKVKFPRATLIEGYGLSECSPIVAANLFEKQKILSVGKPLQGYEVKIVDDETVEVPVGQIGELIVRGDCVMQGYWGLPSATDETIINGWLKTGDLGKVDEDGFIYIVDRKKDLIISKGINVYPREIEELIYKIEGVEACAVVGVKNEHADEEVAAFIELKEDATLDERQVREYLKKHLANYKVPKSVYFAEKLPRNATGKVLKRVLKEQIKDKI